MIEAALARLGALHRPGRRTMVGLAGEPGAGKSTAAEALRAALGPVAAVVPMDGFHLADAELVRIGRRHRKGAPDTFDVHGYVAALQRLRAHGPDTVYLPRFDRSIEDSVAGAIAVGPEIEVVITEGNYLVHDAGGWEQVAAVLDEVWFVDVDQQLRRERLVARHVAFGKTPVEALEWVERSDERNAELVRATAGRARWRLVWN
jgi:pantothenate kinase